MQTEKRSYKRTLQYIDDTNRDRHRYIKTCVKTNKDFGPGRANPYIQREKSNLRAKGPQEEFTERPQIQIHWDILETA